MRAILSLLDKICKGDFTMRAWNNNIEHLQSSTKDVQSSSQQTAESRHATTWGDGYRPPSTSKDEEAKKEWDKEIRYDGMRSVQNLIDTTMRSRDEAINQGIRPYATDNIEHIHGWEQNFKKSNGFGILYPTPKDKYGNDDRSIYTRFVFLVKRDIKQKGGDIYDYGNIHNCIFHIRRFSGSFWDDSGRPTQFYQNCCHHYREAEFLPTCPELMQKTVNGYLSGRIDYQAMLYTLKDVERLLNTLASLPSEQSKRHSRGH
jgi:hypothetical protein